MRANTFRWFLAPLIALVLAGCGGGDSRPNPAEAAMAGSTPMSAALHTYGGNRNGHRIARSATGHTVTILGTGQVDVIPFTSNVALLVFNDVTVNLSIADKSKSIAAPDLKMLIELYVAFFNRIPDADGLAFWIDQYRQGHSLDEIAQNFYNAGLHYPLLTGYSAATTDADFVLVIYKNVLGRSGATAPPDADVQFWAQELASGRATKGRLIRTMLTSAHYFDNHPEWGWVPQLLDNKVAVATSFAVANGLNYRTPEESISNTMALVTLITPTDADTALSSIATLAEPSLDLRDGPAPALASYAGYYTGVYSGDDNGTWQVTIDAAGVIQGTASSPAPVPTLISGNLDLTSGSAVMTISGGARNSTFSGFIDVASGAVSGTWSDSEGMHGTFSGER